MSNPIDDALMSKEALGLGRMAGAAFQGLKRGLFDPRNAREGGKALLTGAMAATGAGMAAGAGVAIQRLNSAATKRRDFREMMDLNPDLSDAQEGNPKFFNASYNSLRRLNPAFGKDPVVSGSIMRRMMENPAGAGTILTGTLKEPEVPRGSTELSVGGNVGPLEYRHRF